MGLRITTNLLSLSVQRNLANTTRAIARSLQRLSSGSRINTGRDDPAGLAMASGLEAQRRGLLQAVRNLNDSRGFLETADGAMAEQANMVQRMRELAVQASNGTLNDATRKYLDNECQALLAEFTRLTTQTQFNGVNLLDGSFTTTQIQAGFQKDQFISIGLGNMQTSNVFATTTYAGNGTFQTRTTLASPSTNPYFVVSGDINGDGKLDLISANHGGSTLSIYFGNGNGTFQSRSLLAAGATPYSVVLVDINNDGKLDIVDSDSGGNTGSIFLGNGDGTFAARTTIRTGSYPNSFSTSDLNGDGKLDLVTSDSGSNTGSIFLGNGDGTFAVRSTLAAGGSPFSVTSADLNGDGKPDLVTADFGSLTSSILLGNGNGTFAARTTVATGASIYLNLVDLNGDGKLDLVTADFGSVTSSILLGNGDGTFVARTTISTGTQPSYIISTDFNRDGKLDLLISDTGSNTVSIFAGNGNGTFRTRSTISTGSGPFSMNLADFNGDSVLDLVTSDRSVPGLSVFLQNTNASDSTATISLTSQTMAQNTLSYLDNALRYISSARANIGALQSRLDFAASVNMNTIENISAARSQIMDTDMAAETAEFARLQILQKAGIAVLLQSNMNSQLSLKLLENL